jgi:hypothetical protein
MADDLMKTLPPANAESVKALETAGRTAPVVGAAPAPAAAPVQQGPAEAKAAAKTDPAPQAKPGVAEYTGTDGVKTRRVRH